MLAALRRLPPIEQAVWLTATRFAGVRRRVRADAIALTLDDGPDRNRTPVFLDRMHELGVIATFFVVGRHAQAAPELVRRAVDAGHAVGSHSWSHPDPWKLDAPALRREYRDGRRAVEDVLGRPVPLFRPPKGFVSLQGAIAMRSAGVRPWLWTIDPGDWQPGITSGTLVEALGRVEGRDVVLLHDTLVDPIAPGCLDRGSTLDAITWLAARARERGLSFTTLAE